MSGFNLREMYRQYLLSEDWRAKRKLKLKVNPRCERCGAATQLQVHHLNYRNWFDVTNEDLQTLCEPCHQRAHGVDMWDRPTKRRRKPAKRRGKRKSKKTDVWPTKGWTREKLARYGESWPPVKGWKRRIRERMSESDILRDAEAVEREFQRVAFG